MVPIKLDRSALLGLTDLRQEITKSILEYTNVPQLCFLKNTVLRQNAFRLHKTHCIATRILAGFI